MERRFASQDASSPLRHPNSDIRHQRRSRLRLPTSAFVLLLAALAFPAPALAGPPGAVGDLYVTTWLTHKVVQFDGQTGAYVGDFVPAGSGGVFRPYGLTWAANGNLFVVSEGTSSGMTGVVEYDGDTGALVGWPVGPEPFPTTVATGWLVWPSYMAIGSGGNLYVSGQGNGAVHKYDGQSGDWMGTFAIGGLSPGGLRYPQGLTFGPNGNLFVISGYDAANPTGEGRGIMEYHHATGRLVRVFATDDTPLVYQQENPDADVFCPLGSALLFRPNGNLLLTSSDVNLNSGDTFRNEVLEFDGATGQLLGVFVADGSGLDWGAGMAWHPTTGNLLVCSLFGGEVLEYDGTTGALVGTFASGLSFPMDLTFKPAPPVVLPSPTVTGFSVAQHNACNALTGVTVTGVDLDPNETLVILSNPNEPLGTNRLVSTYVGVVTGDSGDGTSLTVDFDLDGGIIASGLWDVEVVNPDGQSDTLAAALDVAPCHSATDGNLFVLGKRHRNKSRNGLFEFDGASGDLIGFVAEDPTLSGDDLQGSNAFVFGHDGNVLIAGGFFHRTVLQYDGITGRKIGTFIPADSGGLLVPLEISFGPNGNLFVLHKAPAGSASGVLEFDGLTGAFVREFIPLGSCPGLTGQVAELKFGPNGNLYITNTQRPVDGPNGGVYAFDGQTGACIGNGQQLVLPPLDLLASRALEFSPHDGNLVLPWRSPTVPPGLALVTAHDPLTGALLDTPIPPPAGDIEQASASCFGPGGHLYVAGILDNSSGTQYIFEYDLLTGQSIGTFASHGTSGDTHAEILFKPLLGDADGSWSIDAADASGFAACFTGDGVPPFNNNCLTFDHDRDGDVDCADWDAFKLAWTAPGPIPPLAACGETLLGDLDLSGAVDMPDADLFVAVLIDPAGNPGLHDAADINEDGLCNGADIPGFISALLAGPTLTSGACCLPDGSCITVPQNLCISFLGGDYQGDGTDCSMGCPVGACCLPDGTCSELTGIACAIAAGIYQGDGSDCLTPCPTGACCSTVDGSCSEITEAQCLAAGDNYQSDATTCAPGACPFGQYHNTISPVTQLVLAGAGLQLADDMTLAGTGARDLVSMDLAVYGGNSGGGPFDVTVTLYDACPGAGGVEIPGTSFTFNAVPDDGFVYILGADLSASPVTIPDTVWMVATFSTPQAGWVIAEQAEVGTTADLYARNNPWTCSATFGGFPPPHAGLWANLICIEGSARAAAPAGPGSATEPQLRIIRLDDPAQIIAVEPAR